MSIDSKTTQPPLLLGDHAVLDFLNTVAMVDGKMVDALQNDADVAHWLRQVGLAGTAESEGFPALLRSARVLREAIRAAIERVKAGKQPEVAALNAFLAKSSSHLELVAAARGPRITIERRWQSRTARQTLGPLAEAAAELLATANFELIRKCEDESCVLWFYDWTKSHHRRWCSAATCGNRNKVAAFRRRKQEARR